MLPRGKYGTTALRREMISGRGALIDQIYDMKL
jgi:hypothetical protein